MALSSFPQPENISSCSEFICVGSSKGTSFRFRIQNRTAWPARHESNLCYRYYFGLDNGLTVNDYKATISYTSKPGATVRIFEYSTTVGCVEVCFPGIDVVPGGPTTYYLETLVALGLRTGLSSSLFKYTNDWSYYKSDKVPLSTTAETERVSVHTGGRMVCGNLPPVTQAKSGKTVSKQIVPEIHGTSAEELLVYPNPSYDIVNFNFNTLKEDNYVLNLYNAYGQLLQTNNYCNITNGTGNLQLDLKKYPAGIYFYSLHSLSGEEKLTGKIWRVE
jgi:hypothetical protein